MLRCKQSRLLAMFIGVLVASSPQFALAEEVLPSVTDEAGYYLALGIGRTDFKEYCDLQNTGYITTTFACKSPVVSYRGTLGYQFNKSWSVELRYVDVARTEYTYVGSPIAPCCGTTNLNSFGNSKLSAFQYLFIATLPEKNGFSIFGEIGASSWSISSTHTTTDYWNTFPVAYRNTLQGTSIMYGVGAKYILSKNVVFRAGFESFKAGNLDIFGGRGLGRVNTMSIDMIYTI